MVSTEAKGGKNGEDERTDPVCRLANRTGRDPHCPEWRIGCPDNRASAGERNLITAYGMARLVPYLEPAN